MIVKALLIVVVESICGCWVGLRRIGAGGGSATGEVTTGRGQSKEQLTWSALAELGALFHSIVCRHLDPDLPSHKSPLVCQTTMHPNDIFSTFYILSLSLINPRQLLL